MTDERGNWESRLEALDAQLAAFGIAPTPVAATTTSARPETNSDLDARPRVAASPAANVAGDAPGREPAHALAGEGIATATVLDTAERPRDPGSGSGPRPAEVIDDAVDDEEETDEDRRSSRRRAVVDWVVVIGVALLVAFLVRTFVLAHFVVDGASMSTTLHHDDRVFVNKLSYRLHDPNRGDVVVLHQIEGTSSRDLIKRVVGLPGETVEFRNCVVTIDGRVLEEPYIDPENTVPGQCGRDQAPLVVPPDHVFVMGDNRGQSLDSRSEQVGTVDEANLVGRAFVVFWPRSSWQWL